MKKQKNVILLTIIILLVILIILITVVGILNKKEESASNPNIKISNGVIETDVNYEETENMIREEKLSGMLERDRMEYYVSNFINLLEKKEYEKAYGLLYEDFKAQYFPTAGQFQTYVESKFSSMMNLEFTNIERNGDVYVLWVNMQDAINGNKNELEEYNFVVRENAINDVDISFSVKE